MPRHEYKNITCKGCGISFDSISRNKNQKYCSKVCSANNIVNLTRFKPGEKPWNTGTTRSGMKGKKHSKETKEKMRLSSLGELASNWKGGVSSENEKIRKSGRYKAWRDAVFKRDNYTCQICNDRSATGKRVELHADHIKQFAYHPKLRFELTNGRTLCAPCHRQTPTWGNNTAVLETAIEQQ